MSAIDWRRTIPVATVLLMASFGLGGAIGSPPTAPLLLDDPVRPQSTGCQQEETHNTVRLQATPQAVVRAGSTLNGTAGSVWFDGLPTEGNRGADTVLLKGPDGTEMGPRVPISEEVLFHDAPLCHVGVWRLVDADTSLTLSRFRTTYDAEASRPDTVVLDRPAAQASDETYLAGFANEGGVAYTGRTIHETDRLATDRTVRVDVNWTSDLPAGPTDRAVLTILAEGEHGDHVTSLELPDNGNGTLSVYPEWQAPSVHDVDVVIWGYDDGTIWTHSQARVTLLVSPEVPGYPECTPGILGEDDEDAPCDENPLPWPEGSAATIGEVVGP